MSTHTPFSKYLGKQAEPDRVARFTVNEAMIRQWAEALDDENPIYVDRDAAIAAGRPDIVCPPAMISTWVMQGYRRHRDLRQQRETGQVEDTAYSQLLKEFDAEGFTSVVATNLEQRYVTDIPVGTHVRAEFVIESVSEMKKTGLGEGRFFTLHKRYIDAHDELLVEERFRMLRFKPAAPAAKPRPTGVPPIIRTHDNIFFFDGMAEGKLLIQQCASCDTLRHPPGPSCPACNSLEWRTVESTRQGTLHSWTILHHPQDPAFTYPLAVGLIDLEEGIRFVADFEQVPETLEIGMPVHLAFGPHAHGETLPVMRPGLLPEPVAETVAAEAPVEAALSPGEIRLPDMPVMLDHTAIVAGAMASQDFEDVHHDAELAKERGMRNSFLSINTTNGYVDRFLTDWAGPGSRILSVNLKLGVPHFSGMEIRFAGTATPHEDGYEVKVTGSNDDGVHVFATAIVQLPEDSKVK